jgi:hypothetical protein
MGDTGRRASNAGHTSNVEMAFYAVGLYKLESSDITTSDSATAPAASAAASAASAASHSLKAPESTIDPIK